MATIPCCPALAGPRTAKDTEAIAASALELLDCVGVDCPHRAARHCLEERGARVAGDRVRFPAARVREHLERVVRVAQAPRAGAWLLSGRLLGVPLLLRSRHPAGRPATSAEAGQMARLRDAWGLTGVVPLIPGAVPPALVTMAAERLALGLLRAPLGLSAGRLGVRRFGAVGQLSVDEVLSPQQAVLDREILRGAARVAGGRGAEHRRTSG